jgi:hypothetical protein
LSTKNGNSEFWSFEIGQNSGHVVEHFNSDVPPMTKVHNILKDSFNNLQKAESSEKIKDVECFRSDTIAKMNITESK